MLASAFVSRRRRMHCRGSDTAAERELRRLAPRGDLQQPRRRRRAEVEPAKESQQQQRAARGGGRRAAAVAGGATERASATAGRERGTGSGSAAVDRQEEEEAPAAASGARAEPESARSSAELCVVCLEEVRGAAAAALPCSHAYHPGCLLPWLAVHRACPCCRAAVA